MMLVWCRLGKRRCAPTRDWTLCSSPSLASSRWHPAAHDYINQLSMRYKWHEWLPWLFRSLWPLSTLHSRRYPSVPPLTVMNGRKGHTWSGHEGFYTWNTCLCLNINVRESWKCPFSQGVLSDQHEPSLAALWNDLISAPLQTSDAFYMADQSCLTDKLSDPKKWSWGASQIVHLHASCMGFSASEGHNK